jgi:hypothetical protein
MRSGVGVVAFGFDYMQIIHGGKACMWAPHEISSLRTSWDYGSCWHAACKRIPRADAPHAVSSWFLESCAGRGEALHGAAACSRGREGWPDVWGMPHVTRR